MILESMFGLSFVLNIALDPKVSAPTDRSTWLQLSTPQRQAALLPAVRRATECIVRKVSRHPRYSPDMPPAAMNDLIVDSIAACGRAVRAMMDVHDRVYGAGSGEAFLLGPYLDVLPAAVIRQVKVKTPAR